MAIIVVPKVMMIYLRDLGYTGSDSFKEVELWLKDTHDITVSPLGSTTTKLWDIIHKIQRQKLKK